MSKYRALTSTSDCINNTLRIEYPRNVVINGYTYNTVNNNDVRVITHCTGDQDEAFALLIHLTNINARHTPRLVTYWPCPNKQENSEVILVDVGESITSRNAITVRQLSLMRKHVRRALEELAACNYGFINVSLGGQTPVIDLSDVHFRRADQSFLIGCLDNVKEMVEAHTFIQVTLDAFMSKAMDTLIVTGWEPTKYIDHTFIEPSHFPIDTTENSMSSKRFVCKGKIKYCTMSLEQYNVYKELDGIVRGNILRVYHAPGIDASQVVVELDLTGTTAITSTLVLDEREFTLLAEALANVSLRTNVVVRRIDIGELRYRNECNVLILVCMPSEIQVSEDVVSVDYYLRILRNTLMYYGKYGTEKSKAPFGEVPDMPDHLIQYPCEIDYEPEDNPAIYPNIMLDKEDVGSNALWVAAGYKNMRETYKKPVRIYFPQLEVKRSKDRPEAGLNVFARQDIEEDDIISEYAGKYIEGYTSVDIERELTTHIIPIAQLGGDDLGYLDGRPTNVRTQEYFIANHAVGSLINHRPKKSTNVLRKTFENIHASIIDKHNPIIKNGQCTQTYVTRRRVFMVAKTNIPKGTELFFYYGQYADAIFGYGSSYL